MSNEITARAITRELRQLWPHVRMSVRAGQHAGEFTVMLPAASFEHIGSWTLADYLGRHLGARGSHWTVDSVSWGRHLDNARFARVNLHVNRGLTTTPGHETIEGQQETGTGDSK